MSVTKSQLGLPINGRNSMNSDPTRNFRFLVQFQPYDSDNPMRELNFGFTSVAGLSMAVESIPYREGGMNTTLHQIPGQASFSPITLTRGVHLGNDQAWQWIRRMFAAVAGTAPRPSPSYRFRTSVTIHVLQHPVKLDRKDAYVKAQDASYNDPVAISFRAYNAWITALAYSDLNAGDNAIMVEQMTLVHEGLDMYWDDTIGASNTNVNVQAGFPL